MANKILQIDLQNDITPQIGSYDNAGGVTPNNWLNEDGVYSLGPTNTYGTTPYYWFAPTKEVTDFDICWEDYQNNSQESPQYRFTIGDSAGNNVITVQRIRDNFYFGSVNIGNLAYQTWHKILIQVRKASATTSQITAYVNGKKVAEDTENVLVTSAKIALLGLVPDSLYWQNAGQRVRYVTIYDRSYSSKGVNLDGIMTTITGFVNKLKGALSAVAFSGSYNDLSDKPTISTVNDGTLTIQKNGTNVATFTANQSTAATANITVPTAVSELANDSGYLTASSNLDASKLTSGTVDIARLPQGALERLIKVANEAARYALTTADVQLGDTVQQLDTGIMYIVTDDDHLDSAAGYTEYTAGTAASVPWSGVTGKPTFAAVATSGAYSDLTGTPTIPTVNNATLTIQKNGTNVQTFTANQSTNATANITVPTKTSDLTNDSGFITSDNTKIPLAGSNQISGDLIPATDNTVSLGSSSYSFQYVNAKRIRQNDTSDSLFLIGASSWNEGASISLFGKNNATLGGGFRLDAHNGTNFKRLEGSASDTLSWSGGIFIFNGNTAYIRRHLNTDSCSIQGGTDWDNGATIGASGKNRTGDFGDGCVYIHPNNGSQERIMYIRPNGTWTWNGTACQVTSDKRLKQQISNIDDKLLDAWEDVNPVQFKYNDAVETKSDNARLHTGYVVQQIDDACKSHNVDISQYGLYCHEVYQEETREVEQADGTKTTEVVRPASEHYSLRYTEALIVECAYLRKKLKELTARIEQLEKGNKEEVK